MKRKLSLTSLLISIYLIISQTANAQLWKRSRAELFFAAGATNFLGELGGANKYGTDGIKDFDFPSTRYSCQFGYSYKFTKGTFLQLEFGYIRLSGNDSLTEEPFRQNRNLNFRSHVYQFDAKYMINLTKQNPGHIYRFKGVRGLNHIQIISYAFAGIGCFYYVPEGNLNGTWYQLHDKSTEGQGIIPSRKNYHLFQPVIPFGFGFKWQVSNDWLVGIEFTMHKTFTDYLDDASLTYPNLNDLKEKKGPDAAKLSNPAKPETNAILKSADSGLQRGDPTDHDAYMLAVVSLRYKIPYSQHFLGYPKF